MFFFPIGLMLSQISEDKHISITDQVDLMWTSVLSLSWFCLSLLLISEDTHISFT
jgi:hypothetical protein